MKRAILVGAGGWARFKWVNDVLPAFKDRITVAGLVDVAEEPLAASGDLLDVAPERRFTDMAAAFASVEADFCVISVPPVHHREAAVLAASRGLDILCEKPIADSIEDVRAIHDAVEEHTVKMAITQNYRFEPPTMAVRNVLRSGELGRLNYIVARYAHDYREAGSWRVDHVHERDFPLLVEGSVHHFDMLRNLSGANCDRITGFGWNPEWSSFKGVCVCLLAMQMENGVRAFYEANSLEAGQLNPWFHEAYRAECERGAISVDRNQVVRIQRRAKDGTETVEEVPHADVALTGHHALVTGFLSWMDGGPALETQLSDNVHSVAMLFAAIGAISDDQTKRVADFLP